jgi:amidase
MSTYHRWMEVAAFATLAGLPALAVPAGRNEAGLHIGLQVIGRPGGDNELLGWLAWAERRGCFTVERPTSAVRA